MPSSALLPLCPANASRAVHRLYRRSSGPWIPPRPCLHHRRLGDRDHPGRRAVRVETADRYAADGAGPHAVRQEHHPGRQRAVAVGGQLDGTGRAVRRRSRAPAARCPLLAGGGHRLARRGRDQHPRHRADPLGAAVVRDTHARVLHRHGGTHPRSPSPGRAPADRARRSRRWRVRTHAGDHPVRLNFPGCPTPATTPAT